MLDNRRSDRCVQFTQISAERIGPLSRADRAAPGAPTRAHPHLRGDCYAALHISQVCTVRALKPIHPQTPRFPQIHRPSRGLGYAPEGSRA